MILIVFKQGLLLMDYMIFKPERESMLVLPISSFSRCSWFFSAWQSRSTFAYTSKQCAFSKRLICVRFLSYTHDSRILLIYSFVQRKSLKLSTLSLVYFDINWQSILNGSPSYFRNFCPNFSILPEKYVKVFKSDSAVRILRAASSFYM